jgi:hypothetical protein
MTDPGPIMKARQRAEEKVLTLRVWDDGSWGDTWWVCEASKGPHTVKAGGNTQSGAIRSARRLLRKHLATCPCPPSWGSGVSGD